jgi:5-oxoprolinase (ATP-hydrolysing)
MAQAIRSISIAKGYDPRDYVLVAFGAAGPQHACAVARELDIRRVLVHPDASVLSALGIGLADVTRHRTAAVYQPLEEPSLARTRTILAELARQARADVQAEGVAAERIVAHRSLDLRYRGTDVPLTIAEPADGNFVAAFTAEHRRLYGYVHAGRPLEIVAARVQAVGKAETVLPPSGAARPHAAAPHGTRTLYYSGQWHTAGLYFRDRLAAGATIDGPALIVEPLTTTIVDPHWQATVLTGGELSLTATSTTSPSLPLSPAPTLSADPVLLEVFNNHFSAIATQMGLTLRNTATSVNVKERLDFSCAVFTPAGDLVVNAPHIPVHLGAMSETVKRIIADNPAMQPGDVFVTNDPYRGGSHLPDVTVITPVFGNDPAPPRLLFFTASRAHHAEIGGITPGSMPPFSTRLAEEGVLIRNFKLLDRGVSRLEELRALLSAGPSPSRSVATNLADITAQMAANQQGAADLLRLIATHTLPVVQAYMQHIQDAAERKMRLALSRLPAGRRNSPIIWTMARHSTSPSPSRPTPRPSTSPARGRSCRET